MRIQQSKVTDTPSVNFQRMTQIVKPRGKEQTCVDFQTIARELYITVLKMHKLVNSTESIYEARERINSLHKAQVTELEKCGIDPHITPEDVVVYCRSNPKVPEGYRLVGRVESKYRQEPEEFDPKAICSDDGLRWYLVSRVGEPGCRTLVAEPMEAAI